ncbi:Fic family protein [Fructobacillus sp. M2-14]|uniref:Fic family protein n=1 Tax=Fructobacillus broussonetiae TaxID=2713173 RepID=A0ABS5R1T3_9LACO|nr:Fic family protein [Fructobacillus broussonetiae]MBS9338987.1 Fic family protein [Fructobacillus broussonetiae]
MTYQSLHVFKMKTHADPKTVQEEYENRLWSETTFLTSFKPYLMKKNTPSSKNYPLFFKVTKKMMLSGERLRQNSKRIFELTTDLPEMAQLEFFHDQIVEEIKSTNDIEGVRSTREDIGHALHSDWKSDVRLASTVQLYMDILNQDYPVVESLEDIRFLYDHLLKGEVQREDDVDGKLFRSGAVHIVSHHSNKVVHYAPAGEERIQKRLNNWLRFMKDEKIPSLFRVIIGHFMFENIHPFYDGNGRLGRYLLSVALAKELDVVTAVSLSQAILKNRSTYYNAFAVTGDVENRGEATFFVLKLLHIIEDWQDELIEALKQKHEELRYFTDWQVG